MDREPTERVGDGYSIRRSRANTDTIVVESRGRSFDLHGNVEAFALDLLAMLPAVEVERIVQRALMGKYGDGTDPLYVCVNKLHKLPAIRGEKYYVLGEDSCAYRDPLDIADAFLDEQEDFGHTITTAPIYRLVAVPRDEVDGWIAEAQKERDE